MNPIYQLISRFDFMQIMLIIGMFVAVLLLAYTIIASIIRNLVFCFRKAFKR